MDIWVVTRGICNKMSDVIEHMSGCAGVENNFELTVNVEDCGIISGGFSVVT